MRLPVDRVFTIAGAGTVVTGTMWSGSAKRDDAVEIYPEGERARIRSVQVHSEPVEEAHAGQRVAINIAGVERHDIARGDVIAAPDTLTVTDRFDARFTYLGHARRRQAVRVRRARAREPRHARGARPRAADGGRAAAARAERAGAGAPRGRRSRRATTTASSCAATRRSTPSAAASCSTRCRRGARSCAHHERELLEALLAHDLSSASTGLLGARGVPMTSAQVAAALGVTRAVVADELNRAKLDRLKVANETYFVTPDALEALVAGIERELLAFHDANPSATGISTSALRDLVDRRIEPKVFDAILALAAERGVAAVDGGSRTAPQGGRERAGAEADAEAALLPLIESQGLAPASVAELASAAGRRDRHRAQGARQAGERRARRAREQRDALLGGGDGAGEEPRRRLADGTP